MTDEKDDIKGSDEWDDIFDTMHSLFRRRKSKEMKAKNMIGFMGSGGGGGRVYVPTDFSGLQWWYSPELESYANDAQVSSMADRSGNGVTITQAIAASRPLFKTSVDGFKAILFDGANDYISTTNTSNFLHEGDFTYVTLIKPSNIAASRVILDTNGASLTAKGVYFRIDNSGKITTAVGNGSANVYNQSTVDGCLTVDAWNLIVIRNKTDALAADLQVYVNNILVAQQAAPTNAYGSGASALGGTVHGSNGALTQRYIGHFRDWMAWNRGLTDTELNQLLGGLNV